MPEELALIRKTIKANATEPIGAEDVPYLERFSLKALILIDNPNVGRHINSMIWGVIGTEKSSFEFLTSDRPLIMTNGLDNPSSYLILPIGPRRIFVAVKSKETFDNLQNSRPTLLWATSTTLSSVMRSNSFTLARTVRPDLSKTGCHL
jgi:hypothetical protein